MKPKWDPALGPPPDAMENDEVETLYADQRANYKAPEDKEYETLFEEKDTGHDGNEGESSNGGGRRPKRKVGARGGISHNNCFSITLDVRGGVSFSCMPVSTVKNNLWSSIQYYNAEKRSRCLVMTKKDAFQDAWQRPCYALQMTSCFVLAPCALSCWWATSMQNP